METKKVSIIIPVYNVAAYLDRCFKSILSQDFKDYEVIFIDDGSNDASTALLKSYEQDFPNLVKVFRTKNQGPGPSRNLGLEQAKGEWISFVDADDYLEKDYLSTLVSISEESSAEVIAFNFYVDFNKSIKLLWPLFFNKDVISGKEAARRSLSFINMPAFAWSKFYKKDFLESINFAFPDIYFEDVAVNTMMLYQADKVALSHKALYHYCRREGSEVKTFNLEKLKEALEAIEDVGQFLKDNDLIKTWHTEWQRFLFYCSSLFTIQILKYFDAYDFKAQSEIIKKMQARIDAISQKYE